MMRQCFLGLVSVFLLASCSLHSIQETKSQQATISLPLLHGWHEGKEVRYITTDVSDQEVAKVKNANYAPRLREAIPQYPKPPQVKTVLERVYAFPNQEQSWSVFASVPEPLGYESQNTHYSPLWLMYVVVWKDPSKAKELTSEEAILTAEDQGLVTIERTDIVLNCPVIPFVVGS
ncbi:MAG: hypothetical protein KJ868_17115 [Gammaproteobacteria bacterium]|nr:hypothetical protein [Gammaproteobacteria bacterium]